MNRKNCCFLQINNIIYMLPFFSKEIKIFSENIFMSAFSLKQFLGSCISVNSLFCIYDKNKHIFLSFLVTPKEPPYTCNSIPYIHILLLIKKSWSTFLIRTWSCFPPFIYHHSDIVIHFMNIP